MKRTFSHDGSSESSAEPSKKAKPLVPAGSFADVLAGMEDLQDDLKRSAFSWQGNENSLVFQQLDVQELNDNKTSSILIYGVTEEGHSICVRVNGFLHYFHYPIEIGYQDSFLESLRQSLNTRFDGNLIKHIRCVSHSRRAGGPPTPWLEFSVSSSSTLGKIKELRLKRDSVHQFEDFKLTFNRTIGHDIDYVFRFMIDTGLNGMSWLQIPAEKYTIVEGSAKVSTCQLEISVEYSDFRPEEPPEQQNKTAPLRILSFDIETMIPAIGFPDPSTEEVIQIASMLTRHGETQPFYRSVMTLNPCNTIDGAHVSSFPTEIALLEAWFRFLEEADPDVFTGYNSAHFDMQYIFSRAKKHGIPCSFGRLLKPDLGSIVFHFGRSSLCNYIPLLPGVLNFDMYQYIKQHHSRSPSGQRIPCSLGATSLRFLGEDKEDINYKMIPELQNGSDEDRKKLAVYCMKDAYLPQRLLDNLDALNKSITKARPVPVPFNIFFMRPEVASFIRTKKTEFHRLAA
ncbi:ribonuclease H-like protein [Dendrothele bispora CBS 962.96]|uniref:DNA polymerase delta catalytic subunit n=1 Tax=Dendrothele bispora (strain CBS 962.96) TaxID=1314807 RepID=A0A4S8KZX6_DENBC|nr:ribonuclease H-like protein [Dendrothele bispora CBS 962.96]